MKPSKAATFAKAHRELRPKGLVLPVEPGNPNRIAVGVNDGGALSLGAYTFTPKDALLIAAWIEENFR